ncbi:hypothetical protein ACJJIL_05875 [Microbulbifer sp. EKSA005]|uniref:hypothetical protein n=1 Tax=Microbulbifer sp. EKSA005 TaxID=3243364 RepID=UPI004042D27F
MHKKTDKVCEVVNISRIDIPASKLRYDDSIKISYVEHVKDDDFFYVDTSHNEIKGGAPRLMHHNLKIVRVSDRKILGEFSLYARIGQTFPEVGHVNSTSCEGGAEASAKFMQTVVNVKD